MRTDHPPPDRPRLWVYYPGGVVEHSPLGRALAAIDDAEREGVMDAAELWAFYLDVMCATAGAGRRLLDRLYPAERA